MSILRGYADDLPLKDWLEKYIWPTEGRIMSDEFVYEGTAIATVEAIRSGTTMVNDMYFLPVSKTDRIMRRTYSTFHLLYDRISTYILFCLNSIS